MFDVLRKRCAVAYLYKQYCNSRLYLETYIESHREGHGSCSEKEISEVFDRVRGAARAYGSVRYFTFDSQGKFTEKTYVSTNTFTGGALEVSRYNVFMREVEEYLEGQKGRFEE